MKLLHRPLLTASDLSRLCAPQGNRRDFLRLAGLGAAGIAISSLPSFKDSAWGHGSELFSLGVASGDPHPRGFTIWTRLAPAPLTEKGGMPDRAVRVNYEVAADPQMRRIVDAGSALAWPEQGHNLRVHLDGLSPNRHYWYRFQVGNEDSIIGRSKTLPAPNQILAELRFATVSCQDYQNGHYTAYDHLAQEEIDAVLHLGDYIYEYAARQGSPRAHLGGETQTLADYRLRYAQYRLDPALQAAHAAFPFIFTWDDHEVDDNYSLASTQDEPQALAFRARRRAAYQAFMEHMPLGPGVTTSARRPQIYRSFRFGQLAAIHVLDTRQHRSQQACRDNEIMAESDVSFACDQLRAPDRTMLGSDQEQWLSTRLQRTHARWNVLAQQVMMTPWNLQALSPNSGTPVYNMDAWDGYPRARERMLDLITQSKLANPIVLTGDIHTAWAAELKAQPNKEDAPVVAAEFVTTSITSSFPDTFVRLVQATLPHNPQIRFFEGQSRGYTRLIVRPERWQSDYRGVSTISAPKAEVSTLQSLVVESGSSVISKA